jgi:hypothetical protein
MGRRSSDWSRAFRNDYTEPDPLPEHMSKRVSECSIEPIPGKKTWKNVFLDGELLGMVRVQISGWSECRPVGGGIGPIYCGKAEKLNSRDSCYSLSVLKLREIAGK